MAAPKKNKTQPPATVQNFPIVGIGASAGGLAAFKRLLAAIPESSGMAYVLVQHLDPTHESILPEILQRSTKIPVHEITDDIHLAPDHIYIIPSNKILTSTDGVLQLAPRDQKINLSIDIFFTSLADVHKEFAVGVVLSGTGSDGTLGLKAIKEHGGIGIAQDSESAAYDSMPQSAVNAGVVDFILAPEKIPAQLLQINSSYKTSHFFKAEEELPKDDEGIFKQILLLLRQRSGVDFTYYKQPTFHRRIARRIAIVKKKNLADYLKFLRSNKAEQDALFQDVLIPVTSFFRDPKTFLALTETVFPALFKEKTADEPIRVWIAGCSTGEEAYSIAIALHEYISYAKGISSFAFAKGQGLRLQIFATDISDKNIKKARAAIYTKADVEVLSSNQIKNYFKKNIGGYEVNKIIRDMCVFAPHNFLKDPPFAKMDLITCRNVLIYMDTFLQKKAFATFHYALKESGFLLLGKSETIGASSDLFEQVEKHEKIYSRKSVHGRFMHVATERPSNPQRVDLNQRLKADVATPSAMADKSRAGGLDFRKSAEAVMIAKSPASVVVNEAMDIVHIHGDITPFLQAPQGKPTYNLLKMAREGLGFELRNAIHKAKKEETTVAKENIPINTNGKQSLVTVEIIPLSDTIDPHFLIRFEKKIIPVAQEEKASSSGKTIEIQKRNQQLENELLQTREDMRSITEDMEAANEELQSGNEELQSSNEEMQSLNEELETSKEELQSTNEELIIVNQELLDKQEQLNASRFYAESIVSTVRHPLIVLDKALRVKSANATFYKKFKAEEQDTEGHFFYEIQNRQWDDSEMRSILEKILPKHERLTDFELILKFPTIGERTLLLNALQIVNEKTAEQLILLAIEDVTERKTAELKLETIAIELAAKNKLIEVSKDKFRNLILQAPVLITTFHGPSFTVETINKTTLEVWGKTYEEVFDKPLFEVSPELEDGLNKILNDVYTTGEPFAFHEIEVQLKRSGKPDKAYFNSVYQPLRDLDNKICGIILIGTEVTESVNARKLIEESENLFRTIADTIPHMIWSATAEGHKNYINKYCLDYTGLSFEELKGDAWAKIIFPEDIEKDLELWHHSLKTGDDFSIEKRLLHNDGTYRWHISHAIAQKNNHGIVTGWMGSSTEIEDQKRFTEKLEIKVKERTAELSERKNFIETLIDSSIDTIIAFDKDLRYLSMNKTARQVLEKHFPEGIVGKRMDEVIPHVHDSGTYAQALLALEGNIISQKEYKAYNEEKYYDVDFIPLRNEKEIYGVMAISRDVTESVLASLAIKKANSELVERKNLVEAVLESSKDYIGVYGQDCTLLSINTASEILMGWDRADVVGKTLLELLPDSKGSKEESDLRSALDGNNIHNEAYHSALTGRYIENYIKPLKDSNGNIYAAVAMANDVTNIMLRQKEIESSREILQIQNETFELAESIAKFGSYSWNMASGKLVYSDSLFRLLDCEPDEFVPSFEKFLSFIHPDDLQEVTNNGEETTKTGILIETPYRIISKTGQTKYFRSTGKYTGDGDHTILIGTVQDISKDVAASQELETKNRELENANAELASFGYVASHDLQEPLRKIQGFSKRILDKDGDKLSDTAKDYFNRINGAAHRMQNLIESLLSFSSMGMSELVHEKTDLNQTLQEVLVVLNELITEKNTVIEYQNLPTLNAVPVQMHQLFLNLISNSIKYAKPDVSPYIKIRVEKVTNFEVAGREKRNGKFWKIEISDNGIGFEQQYEHKIFEVFQRLHGKTEYIGTGIGLAICKKIIQAHNGIITATGQPGIGATFTFFLPEGNKL